MEPDIEFGWKDAGVRVQHAWLTPVMHRLMEPTAGAHVLDIGCGNGVMADRYRSWGCAVTGTEISAEGLAHARSTYPEVEFVEASAYDDVSHLAPPGGFDVVVSTEVIEHLIAPQRMVQRAYDAVRPGGTAIITTPYHGYVKNLGLSIVNGWDRHWDVAREGWHIKFFSRRTLEAMLRDVGFVDVELCGAGRYPLVWRSVVARGRRPDSSA
jgi:2-polyprenyl-3-methyl-5-hydroxy-6-metoxy-1,4-benzoquinol methylase